MDKRIPHAADVHAMKESGAILEMVLLARSSLWQESG
jgi:hypothetical protein